MQRDRHDNQFFWSECLKDNLHSLKCNIANRIADLKHYSFFGSCLGYEQHTFDDILPGEFEEDERAPLNQSSSTT